MVFPVGLDMFENQALQGLYFKTCGAVDSRVLADTFPWVLPGKAIFKLLCGINSNNGLALG